jgi:hypothetical protein
MNVGESLNAIAKKKKKKKKISTTEGEICKKRRTKNQ